MHDGPELIGAAHVRRTDEPAAEVVLVGGRDCRRWIAELDRLIGLWAKAEGMERLRAFGRRGWIRILEQQGWTARAGENGATEFERPLAAREV